MYGPEGFNIFFFGSKVFRTYSEMFWGVFSPPDAIDGIAEHQSSSGMLLQKVVEVKVFFLDGTMNARLGQRLGSPHLPGDVNDLGFRLQANHRRHLRLTKMI